MGCDVHSGSRLHCVYTQNGQEYFVTLYTLGMYSTTELWDQARVRRDMTYGIRVARLETCAYNRGKKVTHGIHPHILE